MHSVILVDDEPWSVIDVQYSIDWEKEGFCIIGVYDSPELACQEIVKKKPDLVFTDIKMPNLSGFELIERCRAAGCKSEFVILSGYSEFHYTKQAIQSMVADYCLKPVNPEGVRSALMRVRERLQPAADDKEDSRDHFKQMLKYIQAHYHEKIALGDIAETFSLHRNYICHLFRKNLDDTFIGYLTKLRVEKSKELLQTDQYELTDVASEIGLDYYYFSKVFKRYTGETPDSYRRRAIKGAKKEPEKETNG